MNLLHTVIAGALLASSQLAGATDLELTRLTLSDIRLGYFGHADAGHIDVTESGNLTTLNLTGFAEQMFLERTGSDFTETSSTLYATATPAQGYAVTSLRFRAVLEVTQINAPQNEFVNFSFYLQHPALIGISLGMASDGLVIDRAVRFDEDGIDGSAPFLVGLSAGTGIFGSSPVPAGYYTSVGFRSIALDIETVPLVSQVPEPGTWAMLLAGLAGVAVTARRRKH